MGRAGWPGGRAQSGDAAPGPHGRCGTGRDWLTIDPDATRVAVYGPFKEGIVRGGPRAAGEQFAIDDLDGWRLHAIITNIDSQQMSAAQVEVRHRLRGGIPEDTIRELEHDFGMNHAPVQRFFGNWLYWQAAALAHNVTLWLATVALPIEYRRARGKRLRLGFLNVAARLVRHSRAAAPAFRCRLPAPLQAFATALQR